MKNELTKTELGVIEKLKEHNITDYTDENLIKAFKYTVMPNACFNLAKDLINRGILKSEVPYNLSELSPTDINGVWNLVTSYCIRKGFPVPENNSDQEMIKFIQDLKNTNPDLYSKLDILIKVYLE